MKSASSGLVRLGRRSQLIVPGTLRGAWGHAGAEAVLWTGTAGGLSAAPLSAECLSRFGLRAALALLLPDLADPGAISAVSEAGRNAGAHGWSLFMHRLLLKQMARSPLAGPLRRLTRETIPADPFAPGFRAAGTGLPADGRDGAIGPGWKEAKVPGTQASLIYRADTVSRSILYVWLHSPTADWPPPASGPVILYGKISTIGAGGQIAIPEALRAQAGVLPGSALKMRDAGGVLHVTPAIHPASDPPLAAAVGAAQAQRPARGPARRAGTASAPRGRPGHGAPGIETVVPPAFVSL